MSNQSSRWYCTALTAGLILTIAACEEADERTANAWVPPVVDTMGDYPRVTNGPLGRWRPSEVWTIDEVLRIGTAGGDEQRAFTGPFISVGLGPRGNIYVLDQVPATVSVFHGGTGAFLRRFGRNGRGPGELSSPGALMWDQRDRLWVANSHNGRYTVFDSLGGLVRTVRRPSRVVFGRQYPLRLTRQGTLLDHRSASPVLELLEIDTLGHELSRLPIRMPPRDELTGLPLRPGSPLLRAVWYRPRLVWSPGSHGDQVWTGRSDSLVFVQRSIRGDTILVIEGTHRAGRFTPDERRLLRQASGELGREADFSPILVHALYVMDDGHLLVQVAGQLNSPTGLLDVYDPEGVFLGTVEAPFPIHHRSQLSLRGDTIVAVTLGELDVPYVVKAVIRRVREDSEGSDAAEGAP